MFEKLKKHRWVWVLYISLTIPAVLLLMLVPYCLAPILAAFVIFGIPYLFGVRSVKTFLKAGTVIILITGILLGTLITFFMFEQIYYFEERSVEDTQLVNGSVTPYLGNKATSFNYTVTYTGSEPETNITVYVNITDAAGDYESSISLKNSNGLYYNETILDENTYYYRFAVHLHDNNTWIETDKEKYGIGPITIPFSTMLGLQIPQGILILFMNAGLFFYMVIILYWWRKSAKQDRTKLYGAPEAGKEEEEREEEMEEGEEEEFEEKEGKDEEFEEEVIEKEGKTEAKEEFTCTSCGADVAADDNYCPKCGEEFEGEEKEEEGD
jgi:branched-subunit amino acid transport protein AzlD